MQSIFRLPWCGEQLGAKPVEKPVLERMRSSPAMDMSMLSKMKRKRTVSPEPEVHLLPPQAKKMRGPVMLNDMARPVKAENLQQANPSQRHVEAQSGNSASAVASQPTTARLTASSTHQAKGSTPMARPESIPATSAKEDVAMESASQVHTQLQQAIENQLNMQILLKHNELRLIDQELAKCQVALEQLRRCELRPYPGVSTPAESVTAGVGPTVNPQAGFTRPAHPAPYGVIDGPYTRHYRRWLLNDPDFDSEPAHYLAQMDGEANAASRSTRNSGYARKSVGKSVATPGRHGVPLHSIPNYPVAPPKKDKSMPLVLRRSTDNKLVKLVCNNCNRGDMSSIQGFLNHCRIAHKVDYKSHDAAALDCGRPLDDQEIASLPADAQTTTPAAKPMPKPAPSRAPTAHVPMPPSGAVHPLNSASATPLLTPVSQNGSVKSATAARNLAYPFPEQSSSSPFKPSPQLPRLSALFAKNNLGGDLEQAAIAAKQKIHIDHEDGLPSPDVSNPSSPSISTTSNGMHASHGPGFSDSHGQFQRPPSRKGHRQPKQPRPRPSPLVASSVAKQPMKAEGGEVPESPQYPSSVVSPHTADSNPGLVSDVDDDDNASASEEEDSGRSAPPHHATAASHPLAVPRDCAEEMDLDVTVDDSIDEHGVIIRRNSMLAAEERGLKGVVSASSARKLK